MITVFNCDSPECPNQGIDYNMEGELEFAMCGGCKATLLPIK